MKWTYDPSVDALTILFLEGRASALTREVGIGLLWDFDRNGHPVSIEILDASTHFPVRQLNKLAPPDDVVPLSEAAKRIGLDVSTLRHQIRNKRLRAIKRHREWWVKGSDIEAYLDSRAPQGRRGEKERRQRESAVEHG